MMNLLNLPTDILFEIFCGLGSESLYNCLLVSRSLRSFLKARPEFEYAYRLEKQGLVSVYTCTLPYDSRIRVLRQFTKSWRPGPVTKSPTSSYPIHGDCVAYELVAGVFAKSDGCNLTLQWLPCFTTPAKQISVDQVELGFFIKDFALDPTQDLIAIIEADHMLGVAPCGRKVKLRICNLSAITPHPRARKPTIEFRIPNANDFMSVTIQLADDLLSLFFSGGYGSPQLLLWDWRTGTMILNSMVPDMHLPDSAESFELLGSRSYAIFVLSNNGGICIYNITHPHHPTIPPKHVATLKFPDFLPGIQLSSIRSHTSPFLAKPRPDVIFTAADESRVYIITLQLVHSTHPSATLFVDHSAFVPYIQLGTAVEGFSEVAWDTWSYHKIFFTPTSIASNWLRYVQGNRVLIPLEPENPDQNDRQPAIFVFNFGRDKIQAAPPNTFDIFLEPINYVFPSKTWFLSLQTSCQSFMIDEDYVLGLQTTGNMEERIRKLEFFSMHPPESLSQAICT